MDDQQIIAEMNEIRKQHGPWTAHDIRLSASVSTFPECHQWSADGVRRYMQIAEDIVRRPWPEMTFLDLGCLEGLYAVEAGLRGCKRSVGIDIRPMHIEKAEFAKRVLGLTNVSFLTEDVRRLSAERHGVFDVILCNGLLYHLDTPDVFVLLERMREMTAGVLILDTHVSPVPERTEAYGGHVYSGKSFTEFLTGTPYEAQLKKGPWASAGNDRSFWPTKPSLLNALTRAGYTSVYECHAPYQPHAEGRVTLVAVPGTRRPMFAPDAAYASPDECPER